jgi:hypothetical protein
MKRNLDDSESPPPKKSRQSESKRDPRPDDADDGAKADEAVEAVEAPQRKMDDQKQPYWEVSGPCAAPMQIPIVNLLGSYPRSGASWCRTSRR